MTVMNPEDLVTHHRVTVATRSTVHLVELPIGVLPSTLGVFVDGMTVCGEDARGMKVVSQSDPVGRRECTSCLPPPLWRQLINKIIR